MITKVQINLTTEHTRKPAADLISLDCKFLCNSCCSLFKLVYIDSQAANQLLHLQQVFLGFLSTATLALKPTLGIWSHAKHKQQIQVRKITPYANRFFHLQLHYASS